MTALSSKNCSLQYQLHQSPQLLEASCLLFLIILGKVLLNILLLRVRRGDARWTLMEYFCFSLALVDLLLLEVVALLQAMRIASYKSKAALYFPFPLHCGYALSCREALLPRLIVCFLGTWFPFVALQVLILSLRVQIPAYIEMNVPWLYFVNSFLIAAVYWFNCHKLDLRDSSLPVDPFINWKCCFVPVHRLKQVERPMSIVIC